MSLVIEALRRVEKTDARTGSIGAAVASYRPVPKPRRSIVPLLLGLLAGGAMVFLLGFQSRDASRVSAESLDDAPSPERPTQRPRGAAGLPPPLIIEPAVRSNEPPPDSDTVPGDAADFPARESRRQGSFAPAKPTPTLVLQAISERDSQPIAIINDQLVKEGDKVGQVRVLRIGSDSVEVLLESGRNDTVRFAPPPPPPPEASPSPSPDPRP